MSIPKVVGIEEEYAVHMLGDHGLTPFQASCMLVNSYAGAAGLRAPGLRLLWDYGHETPFRDIRGELFGKNTGQEIISDEENLRINSALPNGARFYTDHGHPEYSTPECLSAKDAVAGDKAGELIVLEGLAGMRKILPSGSVSVFKNNVDFQGHSYGCHENYLVEAAAHQDCFVTHPEKALNCFVPFLATRQIMAGAGKLGGEHERTQSTLYQVSQRADFMEALVGLETMYARPIINTREEHHADSSRFRRLHIILGDANMNEFAGFLKIGSTQIVLQMLEDGFLEQVPALRDPVEALRSISTRFDEPVPLADGRELTATDIQRVFLDRAQTYYRRRGESQVPEADLILNCWEYALDGLDGLRLSEDLRIVDDPLELHRRLDWVTKLWLIDRHRQAKQARWDNTQLRVIDLQYHNIEPEVGLFKRLQSLGLVERILADDEIALLVKEPPPDTRAYFRGKCIQKFAQEICLVNWEVVGFDHGDVRRMVPLLNPLKGTRREFEQVFHRVKTSRELVTCIRAMAPS